MGGLPIELTFAPTVKQAINIVLPDTFPNREILEKYMISLDITNIRILRKIVRLVEMVNKKIDYLHPGVMVKAIETIVILVWSLYDSNERKPTAIFIMQYNPLDWDSFGIDEKEIDPKNKEWVEILQNYGLSYINKFDQMIYRVVQFGYVEEKEFIEEAKIIDDQLRMEEHIESFSDAWKLFRNTFSDNQTELLNALYKSFPKAIKQISPMNLNSTVRLFRELGEDTRANGLIDLYITVRADEKELFDLSESPYSDEEISDPVLIEKFRCKYQESKTSLTLLEAIKFIKTNDQETSECISALKLATVDDFYNFFNMEHGQDLAKYVNICLDYDRRINFKDIAQKTREALMRISKESPLNAIRMKRFKIDDQNLYQFPDPIK